MQGIHQNIISRIESLKNIKSLLSDLKTLTNYNYEYQYDIDIVEKNYKDCVLEAMFNDNYDDFVDAVIESSVVTITNNITEKFNEVFRKFRVRLKLDQNFKNDNSINTICSNISHNLEFAKKVKIVLKTNVRYQQCRQCGCQMIIDHSRSEMFCEYCGIVDTLVGKLQQIEYANTDKVQSAKDDVSRHLKKWLHYIQGTNQIENITKYEEDLSKIKNHIEIHQVDVNSLNVAKMRKILKDVNMTDYNYNCTKLIVDCGGPAPPTLSTYEFERVCMYVQKIFSIKKTLKKPCNKKPYYPYYIYKVFENILPEEKKPLMNYVHFQDPKTLKKCDLEFKDICAELKKAGITDINYQPTIIL